MTTEKSLFCDSVSPLQTKEVQCLAQLPQKFIWINVKDLNICEPPLGPLMETTLKVQRVNELNDLS